MSPRSDLNVVWAPHPGSQTLFLTCPCDEVLYHGTRGPGKTDALIMDFAREVGQGYGAAWRGILFRQTFPQLKDVIRKTQKWFPQIFPNATYNASDHEWRWSTGETLLLSYMDKPEDYWNYHGHEYPWIGWEELTNWRTMECYEAMLACNRTSDAGIPRRVRATCNPWGAGHHAVKHYFIDPAPACVPVTEQSKHPLTGEVLTRTRTHIFGHLFENTTLLENDPEYLINLQRIKDKAKRDAWLRGSWDITAGSFFGEAWKAERNVINHPWTPPKGWLCYASFDWGSASPFSVGFWCESDGTQAPDGKYYPRGALIRFDEWYGGKRDEPNVGLKLSNQDIGAGIVSRLQAYENNGLRFRVGPADPSIFKEDGGPSIYAQMKQGAQGRELFNKADNTRIAGWKRMAEMMVGDDDRGPMLHVMANCRAWLRTVPILGRDDRNWDDIDTDEEDHAADETRYMCMWRPKEAKVVRLTGY